MLPTVLSPLPAVQPAADGARRRCRAPAAGAAGRGRRRTTPASLRLLARAARGSMRDALSLTDQAIAYGGGALDEDAVRAMLGASTAAMRCALVRRAGARGDGAALVAAVDALRALGLSARRHARRDGRRCCSRWRSSRRCPGALDDDRPRHAAVARAGRRCCRRRDAAALQHRAARPRRAGAGARRVQRPGDGAAAHAGVSRRRRSTPARAPARRRQLPTPRRPRRPRRARRRRQRRGEPPRRACPPATPRRADAAARGSTQQPPDDGPMPAAAPPHARARSRAAAPERRRWADALAAAGSRGWSQRQAVTRAGARAGDAGQLHRHRRRRAAAGGCASSASRCAPGAARQAAGGAGRGCSAAPVRSRSRPGAADDTPARRDAAERERRQREAEAIIHNDPLVQELMRAVQDGAHRARLDQTALKEQRIMMKNQLAGLMKQAQAMQDNLKRAQDELAPIEVEGQSGAGLVKVTMTCKHDVKRVTIDPSLLADDKDMLEDLVAAAFNDAVRRAEEVSAGEDGQADGRHAAAAGHEVPVLAAVSVAEPALDAPDRRAAPPARRRRQVGAAHGVPPAAARPRRRAAARRVRCSRRWRRCTIASAATPSPRRRSARTCLDAARDARQLCVVETPADQAALERTGSYRGLYFVLMGRISPLDGIGVRDIGVAELLERAGDGVVRGGDPRHRLHRRRRGHRACAGAGAARARPAGHAAGARRAGRQRAGVRRPVARSRTRWSTGAERQAALGAAALSARRARRRACAASWRRCATRGLTVDCRWPWRAPSCAPCGRRRRSLCPGLKLAPGADLVPLRHLRRADSVAPGHRGDAVALLAGLERHAAQRRPSGASASSRCRRCAPTRRRCAVLAARHQQASSRP